MHTEQALVPPSLDGERVDVGICRLFGCSRARAQALIAQGAVQVDGGATQKARKLVEGQLVTFAAPPPNTTLETPADLPILSLIHI